ncbi:MAG: 30S ribosomal protein S21 [Candidatus Scalindua sp.]|jgi:small subunit ribosomal protein S21|nr:30S ribosomal protein S21 [Candidatus Scalindua sp.]
MGVKVLARRNENTESLIRRFKRLCERSNVLKDHKKHSVYEKPSDRRKREKIAKKKNYRRYIKELNRSSAESIEDNFSF